MSNPIIAGYPTGHEIVSTSKECYRNYKIEILE
jgi:hypothetical protein